MHCGALQYQIIHLARANYSSFLVHTLQSHTKDKDRVTMDWISRFIVTQPPLCPPSLCHTPHSSTPDHSCHTTPSTFLSQPPSSTSSTSHPPLYTPSTSFSQPPPSSHVTHPSSSSSLLDTFRHLHQSQGQAYTCWSTLLGCRKTNFGTRIDYILASTCLASRILQAEVWQHVQGSDHCPVFAELDMCLLNPSERHLPSLCSDYYSGRQSKLSNFISCQAKETKGKGNEEEITGSDVRGHGAKRSLPPHLPPPAKRSKSSNHGMRQTLFSVESLQRSSKKEIPPTKPPQRGGLSKAWKSVFSGAPKPPLCGGHGEPCVLRKVKKQGANKDRGFWVCARPMGGKGDPLARCDHFQWSKEKTK